MNQARKKILHEIILAGENQKQEFKSSFSKETIETLTAFANSTGGSVYIGIDDRGNISGYYFKGKAQREERWEYPLEAIREIIINMIVHRDYMAPGDSIIKIFDESIEFFNPGRLAGGLTAEQLTSGNYISAVRNKF